MPSKVGPVKVWDDSGAGGKPASFWDLPHGKGGMGLLHCTEGQAMPDAVSLAHLPRDECTPTQRCRHGKGQAMA